MEKTQLLILSAAIAFLAFRIYQKYVNKSRGNTHSAHKGPNEPGSSASTERDDYEPYSK